MTGKRFAVFLILPLAVELLAAVSVVSYYSSHKIASAKSQLTTIASGTLPAPISISFLNSNPCRVEVVTTKLDSSIASAATATVMSYCDGAATGTVYGTIDDANYFSSGEIVDGSLYVTKSSNPTTTIVYGQPTVGWPQNQVWLYTESTPIRLVYSLPKNDTSSINAISVSPDATLIAVVEENNDLDIVTSGGLLQKRFRNLPPGVTPAGWGRDWLWLNLESQDGAGYASIGLADWAVNRYYPTEGLLNDDASLNYDTGELAESNFPWFGDTESYSQFISDSTTTISLFLDDLVTGATETVATANVATLRGDFNPQWIDDHTLQYNVSSTTTATTSIP